MPELHDFHWRVWRRVIHHRIAFDREGKRVSSDELMKLIESECYPYHTKDEEGVLVYMSKKEYDALQNKHSQPQNKNIY